MNLAHSFLVALGALVSICASAAAQAISPPVSKDFPFRVGIIMDGGSFYIQERQFKDGSNEFYFDGSFKSNTRGELYSGGLHQSQKGTKLLSPKEANRVFTRWRAALAVHFGAKELQRIKRNPIDLESIPEAKAEKLATDPKFNNRIAAQMLLQRIQEYGDRHKQGPSK